MRNLPDFLAEESPGDLARILTKISEESLKVKKELPFGAGITKGVNPSGETQAELDVYANDLFTSSLLSTGAVAEVASEEMAEAERGSGRIHVAMDPLDGSSNISTNNPLGSIFAFYSSPLPCSGEKLLGAAYVTYGPMLTLTFSVGKGTHTFVAVEGEGGGKAEFSLLAQNIRIPPKAQVYGLGGQRAEWTEPVERFVSSLEARGMKLRYGGTFVADYNQVIRYGGIFGYPALKNKPKGKLRLLFEAAPMAFIMKQCGGHASDGRGDPLRIVPTSLSETTPIYVGSGDLVIELEALIAGSG